MVEERRTQARYLAAYSLESYNYLIRLEFYFEFHFIRNFMLITVPHTAKLLSQCNLDVEYITLLMFAMPATFRELHDSYEQCPVQL